MILYVLIKIVTQEMIYNTKLEIPLPKKIFTLFSSKFGSISLGYLFVTAKNKVKHRYDQQQHTTFNKQTNT